MQGKDGDANVFPDHPSARLKSRVEPIQKHDSSQKVSVENLHAQGSPIPKEPRSRYSLRQVPERIALQAEKKQRCGVNKYSYHPPLVKIQGRPRLIINNTASSLFGLKCKSFRNLPQRITRTRFSKHGASLCMQTPSRHLLGEFLSLGSSISFP